MIVPCQVTTLRDKVKSVDIRKELGVNSINEKVVDMIVPGKQQEKTKREMGGLRPKEHAKTADHPGG